MQIPILFPFWCGIVFIVQEEAQIYRSTFPFLCCDLNISSLARPQKLYEPDASIPFNHCGATFSQITQAKRNPGTWLRVPSSLYSDNHETPNELPVISGHLPISKNSSLAISIMGMLSGIIISTLFDAHPLSYPLLGFSVDSATGESNRLVVWASHWLVSLCPFYRQSLSLVYTCFFPCETCAPSSLGNYWQNILATFCPGYWFSDSSHMIKSKFSGGITVDISLLPPLSYINSYQSLIFETYMSPLCWKRTQSSYTLDLSTT